MALLRGDVTEESPVNPQTAYADCKTLVERDVMALADDSFLQRLCGMLQPLVPPLGCRYRLEQRQG